MRIISPAADGRRAYQGGSILGVSAIAMLAILGAVGLAVDIGHMYLVAAELQNAADAAALAGASALNGGAGGITLAVDRAIVSMNAYEFNRTTLTLTRADVRFAAALSAFDNGGTGLSEDDANDTGIAPTIRFVKVSVPAKTISTVVAQAFMEASGSTTTFAVARSAVAGQSVTLNSVCNFAPFSVVQDGNNIPLHPGTNCTGDPTKFNQGCTYTIRLSAGGGNGNDNGNGNNNNNSTSIAAGNYLLLAIGSDRGGSDLRNRLGIGVDSCYQTNQVVSTEPGVTAGPVRQGLNTRFDDYNGSGMSPTEFPPDTNIKAGITYDQYKSGSTASSVYQAPTHTGYADRRVMIIPIINASSFDSGRNEVTIASFGAFFMQGPVAGGNGGEITAEYIGNTIVVGNGGYVPGGGPGIAGLTVPVLYR